MNNRIREYIKSEFERFQNDFNIITNVDKRFRELYSDLLNVNKDIIIRDILEELITNCSEWWINPDKGIKMHEELYAILFEYDYDIFQENVEASAYGISEWSDAEIQIEDFDMGFNYDFATEFYASPGITIKIFNPLVALSSENLQNEEVDEEEGYLELINMYKYFAYLCIHDAIMKFSQTDEYKSINKKKNFQFFIGEHNSGVETPLWIHE